MNSREPRNPRLQIAPARYAVTVTEGAGYVTPASTAATKTLTPLLDVPQSITVVTQQLIHDQMMLSVGDVVRYVPGVTAIQGENNRDQLVIRGNSTSADFFVDGVRDDVQYYRDLYNLDRVEVLKGPNAMIFGRGGGGGVINRVTKEAEFMPLREVTLTGGMYDHKRFATDLNQALNDKVAVRLNGMYENSGSFRKYMGLTRYGINPTLTFTPTKTTRITLGYERFRDDRSADRGIPSFQGRPLDVPIDTFFGNPDLSHVRASVNLGSVNLQQQVGRVILHNRTTFGDYDRGYQNFVPGAVSADKTQDTLTAYNNATKRFNFFNQTDVTYTAHTGKIKHTLLAGAEVGRQLTDNFRNTGFFNNTATSILIPLSAPAITTPTTFRQSATDADNHLITNVAAAYVQDQVELSRYVQLIGGVRFDRFDLQYHNNRTGRESGPHRQAGIAARRNRGEARQHALHLRKLQRVLSAQLGRPVLVADHDHPAGEAGEVQQLRSGRQVGLPPAALADHRRLPAESREHQVDRSQRSNQDHPDRQHAHQRLRDRAQRKPDASLEHRRRLCVSGRVHQQRDHGRARGAASGPGSASHVLAVEQLSDPAAAGRRLGNSAPVGHVRRRSITR